MRGAFAVPAWHGGALLCRWPAVRGAALSPPTAQKLSGPWGAAPLLLRSGLSPLFATTPRFLLAAAVVAAATAAAAVVVAAAAAAAVVVAATAAAAIVIAAPAVPAAAAAAQQEDQDDDPPAAPAETTIVTTTHDFVTSQLISRPQRPARTPPGCAAPELGPVEEPGAGAAPRSRFWAILCGGREMGS